MTEAAPAQVAETRRRDGFVNRGKEVSRLEAFSDAAFGFAVTLLVVTLNPPTNYQELIHAVRGMPAFAICFALVVWLWTEHYAYFRRFGLNDAITITLNSALLFAILFYVYPLRLVFAQFVGYISGLADPEELEKLTHDAGQVRVLFTIYGLGCAAVFSAFTLMYLHAWRLRNQLGLDELEQLQTKREISGFIGYTGLGIVSAIVACILPEKLIGLAGWMYMLMGVIAFTNETIFDRKKRALEKRLQDKAGPAR